MTTTNDCVVWISLTGQLNVWQRRCRRRGGHSDDGPQCLETLGFHPPPHLIAATEDGEVVLCNGVYLGLYALERRLLPLPERPVAEEGEGGPGEELVVKEVFVIPCRIAAATHLSVSRDGATVAISSPTELLLANCRDISEAENRDDVDPFDAADDGYGSDRESLVAASLLRVNCMEWFGQDVLGGSGCAATCFYAPDRLVVLGTGNHLVTVSVDWIEQAVWLVRDGHVVTRKHRVLCIAANRDLIALGCSDGTVKLLQSDTPTVFKTVDVVGGLHAHFRQGKEESLAAMYAAKPWLRPALTATNSNNSRRALLRGGSANVAAVIGRKTRKSATATATASPTYASVDAVATTSFSPRGRSPGSALDDNTPSLRPSILDIAVGNKDILVALADLVVPIDRDTLMLQTERMCLLSDEEDGGAATGSAARSSSAASGGSALPSGCVFQVSCASGGSWSSWCARDGTLLYYVAAPRLCEGDGDANDIVHAACPLRRNWSRAVEELRKRNSLPSGDRGGAEKKGSASGTALVTRNKPVTFGGPIKSSGYGEQVPWSVQQERKRAAAERAKRLAQRQQMGPVPGSGPATYRRISGPYADHRFTPLASTNRILAADVAVHRSAVLSCTFTASGEGVVTTSGNGGYYLRLPVTKYKGDGVLLRHTTMHDGAVTLSAAATTFLCSSANLSLKTPIVATGNADGVIHLWKPHRSRSTGGGGQRFSSGGAASSESTLRAGEAPIVCHPLSHRKEIRSVRFFYLDKFLAYSAGSSLSFSPYWLDERRRDGATSTTVLHDDLNRFKNDSVLGPPVFTYKADAQQITSMDCVNHFASPLVVLSCSNRSLTVLDINAEAPLRTVKDAHQRGIHKVALAASSASRFAAPAAATSQLHGPSGSQADEHLFASAGLDNAATLWDLRQDKPVRQFALHKNAALTTVGLAFDPTATLLAVGSEDRAMYLYDTRVSTAVLDVVKCGEVPSSIAFHPLEPVVAVGLVSGAVMFYSQKDECRHGPEAVVW